MVEPSLVDMLDGDVLFMVPDALVPFIVPPVEFVVVVDELGFVVLCPLTRLAPSRQNASRVT